MVLALESVCSPSCLHHCLSSCVSLSGTEMQLFLQQSFVPRLQPQLPQTIFSMPGILGKRAKKQILGTLFHLLVCSASLSDPQGCILTSSCAFLLSRRYRKQVACLGGVPTLPILPKMCSVCLAIKTWILLVGPRALKLQWSFGREVLSRASLAAGKCWGLPQGRFPAALLQPIFSAQVLPGRRLAPPQMTCFHGLPCRGVGEEP